MQNTRLLIGLAVAALGMGTGSGRAADGAGGGAHGPEAVLERDARRARLDGRSLAAGSGSGFLEGPVRVLEANRALGLVVLEGGSRRGLRAGMALVALRRDQPLARVRLVDVRRRVAGAVVVELLPGGAFPGPGDRLVVVTDGE